MEKISVLYVCHAPNTLGGAVLSLVNLIDSVRNFVYPIVLVGAKGAVYDFLKQRGITCIVIPFKDNIAKCNSFVEIVKYIPKLYYHKYINNKCLKKISLIPELESVRIVHSNSSVITVGADIAKKLSCKHVWHLREFQDIDFCIKPLEGWKNLKRQILNADAVIAITKAVYSHFELDNNRNSYCIWDAVRSQNEALYDLNKEKYFLFCAADLCKAKGTGFAIKAFGESKLALQGYKLLLVGNTVKSDLDELKQIEKFYGIEQAVEYLGYSKDIKSYMAKATAFLMCSLNEGLGRVTVEAMFYGCPVIARSSGGTLELITNGVNGFFFSTIEECALLMNKVVSENVNDVILNAQQYAIQHFSEEVYGQEIMNVYYRVLNSGIE